jgi:Fe-S-cluster containining protein
MFGTKSNKIYDTRKGRLFIQKISPFLLSFVTFFSCLMSKWLCIENCGACCNLDPRDRPDLADYLSKSELDLYLSMVGEDGWCINYNKESRKCQIYENRPRFCRVKPDIFQEMYEIPLEEFEEFAIDCCHQQIEGVYGEESEEINNYRTQVT